MSFERLPKERQTWMRTQLTEFINRSVIYRYQEGRTYQECRVLVDVDSLNSQSRWDLAEQWYREQVHISSWYLNHFNELIRAYYGNYEAFIQDMAIYIDSRIPKAYIKHKENLDKPLNSISVPLGIDMTLPYGLKYQYSENMGPNLPARQQGASIKQEKYLISLSQKAGYSFVNCDSISKKEASECISYFLEKGEKKEPECFSLYFRKTL